MSYMSLISGIIYSLCHTCVEVRASLWASTRCRWPSDNPLDLSSAWQTLGTATAAGCNLVKDMTESLLLHYNKNAIIQVFVGSTNVKFTGFSIDISPLSCNQDLSAWGHRQCLNIENSKWWFPPMVRQSCKWGRGKVCHSCMITCWSSTRHTCCMSWTWWEVRRSGQRRNEICQCGPLILGPIPGHVANWQRSQLAGLL